MRAQRCSGLVAIESNRALQRLADHRIEYLVVLEANAAAASTGVLNWLCGRDEGSGAEKWLRSRCRTLLRSRCPGRPCLLARPPARRAWFPSWSLGGPGSADSWSAQEACCLACSHASFDDRGRSDSSAQSMSHRCQLRRGKGAWEEQAMVSKDFASSDDCPRLTSQNSIRRTSRGELVEFGIRARSIPILAAQRGRGEGGSLRV